MLRFATRGHARPTGGWRGRFMVNFNLEHHFSTQKQPEEAPKPGATAIFRDIFRSPDGPRTPGPTTSNRASIVRILSLLKPEVGPLSVAIGTLGVTTAISLVFPAAVGQVSTFVCYAIIKTCLWMGCCQAFDTSMPLWVINRQRFLGCSREGATVSR